MHEDERRADEYLIYEEVYTMTFYYSIKQMFRSPLKSILFFLLVGVSAFLLALGGSLSKMNAEMIREFENIFTTIGTVDQKDESVETIVEWDAGRGDYVYSHYGRPGKRVSNAVLDFEGAGYILEARQRPYFGARIEEKVRGGGDRYQLVAELTAEVSDVLEHSVPMRVNKVLAGNLKEGDTVYICDHYGDSDGNYEPRRVEEGKTYIMRLHEISFVHGPWVEHIAPEEYVSEYEAINSVASYQYTMDGERVFDAVAEAEDWNTFDEVTQGFYETERGMRWLELAKAQDYEFYTVPVEPVDGTNLLLPFYQNEAQITEGRDITGEEYEEGKNVCLISVELARVLRKGAGDSLTLPLYYAAYAPAERHDNAFLLSILNAKGKAYPVFCEQDYEIAGIYKNTSVMGSGEHELAVHEVIVPWNSIPENAWADNIVRFEPMSEGNTSFQIPNGTIDDFMEAWEKQGVEGLDIKFYDKGYSHLQSGIENRKLMAGIFLASGCMLAAMILCFFSNLFITGQQERIAVERLLGRTKKQCALSILTGLFVLAFAGMAAGSMAGWMATGSAVKATENTTEFDATFSNTIIDSGDEEETKITAAGQKNSAEMAVAAGCMLMLAEVLISFGFMWQELKKEPLQILGGLEE